MKLLYMTCYWLKGLVFFFKVNSSCANKPAFPVWLFKRIDTNFSSFTGRVNEVFAIQADSHMRYTRPRYIKK